MSEFIASAEIAIIPNTRGFRNQLKDDLADATKKPVAILVTPNPKGFSKDLRDIVLNAEKLVKARILIEPDPTNFETKLRAAVKKAADRVTAQVKVTTGPVTTRAPREVAAPRTRRPAPVLSDTGKPLFGAAAAAKTEARAREKERLDALKKIQAAEVAAHAENIKRDRARAAADLAARKKVLADLEKQGLLSRTGKPLTGAARDAKLEAQARIKANADALKKMQADEIAAHAKNLRLDQARIAAETRARNKARADLEKQGLISKTGRPITGAAREVVLEKRARVAGREAQIAAAQAQATKVLNQARTAEITIANAEIGAMNKLEAARARERVAQKLATEATVSRQTAERLGLTTTSLAIAKEEQLALERLATEQRTLKTATSEVTLAKRRAFGLRGLVAQFATFAGLRGAVLSANAAFIAGTVAAIAFGKAIGGAARFESELNVFRVTSGATADQMERVSAQAQALGRDVTLPGVAANDAAEAMTSLAKAGLSVEDSLAGARGVLQLATAAQISNAEATELAASALNAFGLAGTDAVHVADVFANSANAAQGSISDVGIALQQAAAVSRQVGVSFEDTVALLTLLARNGIRGSDAGTALRVAFTRLIAPTKEAAAVLERLNVRVRDAEGNLRPEIFADIAQAMADLSRKQQDSNAKIIFGVDALRAYSIAAREGLGSLNQTRRALDEQGSAAELAAARTSGLLGAVENLKNQLATTASVIGQAIVPGMTDLVDVLAQVVGVIGSASQQLIEFKRLAEKPIDIVVNVIRRVTGAEEPEEGEPPTRKEDVGGLVSGIVDVRRSGIDIAKDFFQLGVEANAALEDGLNVDTVDFPTLSQARSEIRTLLDEFNKTDAKTVGLNELVLRLKAMQKEMSKGTFGTKEFAKSLGPFIEQLQELPDDAIVLDIEFPKSLTKGAASFEQAARVSGTKTKEQFIRGFGEGLLPSLKELGKRAMESMAEGMQDPGAAGAIAAALKATIQAANRSAGIEEELDILTIVGASPAARRAKLVEKAAVQRRIIAESNIIGAAGDALKRRRAARKELASIMEEIRQIDEQAAAEVEKKAKEAQDLRNKADQALLDSFRPAERRVERRITLAEQTPGLKDDIAAARARKQQLLKQIAVIRADFKDRKAAAEEIFKRRQEILDIEDQIRADERAMRDEITTNLGKRIELAELQGNRGAILKAIDRAIADAKLRVKRWKALGLVLLDEQINLARLIKDRKDFLKELMGEESPDVFANRLFTEAADQFRRFGSNISTSRTGVLAPQDARGVFARNLLAGGGNVTNLTENLAQRTRESQLAEERKQTTYLRIIAGGPRTKFVRGAPIPPEVARTMANIGANITRSL